MRSTTASLALLAAFGAGCATGGAERSATPTAAGEPTRAPSAIAVAQSEPRARETLERGRAAMARGDSATAARSFRETLRLQPTLIEAREGLGLALYEMGDLDGTVEELRALLRQHPDAVRARQVLATALMAKQAWPDARVRSRGGRARAIRATSKRPWRSSSCGRPRSARPGAHRPSGVPSSRRFETIGPRSGANIRS